MTIRELLDSNTNSFSHLVVKSTEGDVLYDGPCADILTMSKFIYLLTYFIFNDDTVGVYPNEENY